MNEEPPARKEWHYHAFVLRLWATEDAEKGARVWRFSLEDTRTGKRLGFATFEGLVEFLVNQTQ